MYISLTRRQKIGAYTGVEVAVLYHSLAIIAHRCDVNVFEHLCGIIDYRAACSPNTPYRKISLFTFRNMEADTKIAALKTGRLSFLYLIHYPIFINSIFFLLYQFIYLHPVRYHPYGQFFRIYLAYPCSFYLHVY